MKPKDLNHFHYSNKSREKRKTCPPPLTFVTFNVSMNNFHLINSQVSKNAKLFFRFFGQDFFIHKNTRVWHNTSFSRPYLLLMSLQRNVFVFVFFFFDEVKDVGRAFFIFALFELMCSGTKKKLPEISFFNIPNKYENNFRLRP